MLIEKTDYYEKQKTLRSILRSPSKFDEAMHLVLSQHDMLHFSTNPDIPLYCDILWSNVSDTAFRTMPTKKDETIAWHIWHITRIEDLVSNLLISNQAPILDDSWLEVLNITTKDTGNAMNDDEILFLSTNINKEALKSYRQAVSNRTRSIIKKLTVDDIKQKPTKQQLDQLVETGGLLPHKKSVWLKEFWGNKTIAGLLLLPITRHHYMHLKQCKELLEKQIK